jgi:competence protein ComEA
LKERDTRDFLWGWSTRTRRIALIAFALLALAVAALSTELRTRGRPRAVDARLVIDLNTAPPAVLMALPRLGPVLVDRIVKERQARPFRSLADFDDRVKGIGPVTVAALAPYARFEEEEVEPAKTVMTTGDASRPAP